MKGTFNVPKCYGYYYNMTKYSNKNKNRLKELFWFYSEDQLIDERENKINRHAYRN